MKKIFTIGLLLAPIVANANPVGPSAVGQGQTAVVATASAPYQTAAPANGDSTTVVSASYVKGAYNDAIAAVNKVNSDKQNKLINEETGNEIDTYVISADSFNDITRDVLAGYGVNVMFKDSLVSAEATATAINEAFAIKKVNALATWGSNNVTQLSLQNQQ